MQSIVDFVKNIINNIKYSDILQNLQIPNIHILDVIEIFVIVFAIYKLLQALKDTRAWIIFKGVVMLFGVYVIAYIFSFEIIMTIFEALMSILAVGVIILFQGELRKMLENIGTKDFMISFNIKKLFKKKEIVEKKYISDKTISSLVIACREMSKVKTGALIVIKKDIPLNDYISTGIDVDSKISSQMLIQIFEHNTPLHDGALIIENDRLTSATCYLPLSENSKISKELGTRHRAGIGITEVSDCLVIIVSEETGAISIANNGRLSRKLSDQELEKKLREFQSPKIKKVDAKSDLKNKKNLLIKNKRYKLISFVVGVLLWLVLTNTLDPVITRTINYIPVEVTNEQMLMDIDQTYNITSGRHASIVIKGRRSVVDGLTAEDFTAVADFKNLSIINSIPVEINSEYDVDIVENNNFMNVAIEELSSIECKIEVQNTGDLSDSLYIKSIDVLPGTITITGPKSLLNTIDKAVVISDLSNVYNGFSEELTPIIYDRNGSEIDVSNLYLSKENIKIVYNIYDTKDVEVKLNIINTKFEDGEITSFSPEPSTIRIAADSNTLNTTNKITLNVELEVNDSTTTSNMINTIDINEYLPSNLYLKGDISTLNINFSYEQYVEEEFIIDTSNISIKNKSEDYNYIIDSAECKITVKGLAEKIESFNILSLNPSIDASLLEEGINFIKPSFNSNVNIKDIDSSNINIRVEPVKEDLKTNDTKKR